MIADDGHRLGGTDGNELLTTATAAVLAAGVVLATAVFPPVSSWHV